MRLLHTTELRFEEFFDNDIPAYAILSHRWGDNEVSYQDFEMGRKQDGVGYAKIIAFCELAATDTATYVSQSWLKTKRRGPFEWVWIDTCCIDKSSSAELSEAINSMYRWYAKSVVCYAYLSDVETATDLDQAMKVFEGSQWFHRGWTLQELLAPHHVIFYSSDWTRIGSREGLSSNIVTATGIRQALVTEFCTMKPALISTIEKLSWLAGRTTSRVEDQAYCLLGLFGINMPLLYGEGRNASRRLQLEIIRSTNDESIFVRHFSSQSSFMFWKPAQSEVLVTSFRSFSRLSHGHQTNGDSIFMSGKVSQVSRPPYTITNQGLEIRVPKKLASKGLFFWPLNYRIVQNRTLKGVFAIILGKGPVAQYQGMWHRRYFETLPETLPVLPAVECGNGHFQSGLFIAPESWLWSRDQLDAMETTVIYVEL